MPYVVKISAYLGKDGKPVGDIKDAIQFEKEDVAEIATIVAGGVVTRVKEAIIMPPRSERENKSKQTKSNQFWMKGTKEK